MSEPLHHKSERPKPSETELGRQVETVTQDVKELGRLAGEDARRRLADARDRGEQLYDRWHARAGETVGQRPLGSLLAAAGLGLLAGLLIGRR